MKLTKHLSASILIMSLLTVRISYGQIPGQASYEKGIEFATQGKFIEAKLAFEKALKEYSAFSSSEICKLIIDDVIGGKIKRDTAIHLFKGTLYHNKNDYELAIQEYNQAIKIDPMYPGAYNNRGFAYAAKGQYDVAICMANKRGHHLTEKLPVGGRK